MKLSELMAGYSPDESYAGIANTDDFVLAIDIASTPSGIPDNYIVVETGITSVDAQLNPETDEKTYLRMGKSTNKTATQRTFNITGDRFEGDDFQDFACSHAIKFGKGQKIVKPYVYFSLLTGKGESGQAAIIVNSDGSGDAGASAEVDIDIMCNNSAPTEYTYSAGSASPTNLYGGE